jgi:hypothetical protein
MKPRTECFCQDVAATISSSVAPPACSFALLGRRRAVHAVGVLGWVSGALAALGTTLTVALVAIGWLFQQEK